MDDYTPQSINGIGRELKPQRVANEISYLLHVLLLYHWLWCFALCVACCGLSHCDKGLESFQVNNQQLRVMGDRDLERGILRVLLAPDTKIVLQLLFSKELLHTFAHRATHDWNGDDHEGVVSDRVQAAALAGHSASVEPREEVVHEGFISLLVFGPPLLSFLPPLICVLLSLITQEPPRHVFVSPQSRWRFKVSLIIFA